MWVRSNISSLLHCQQGAFNAFKYFQRALLPLWIHFSWKFVCLLFEFHVSVSCLFVAIYLVVGWEKRKKLHRRPTIEQHGYRAPDRSKREFLDCWSRLRQFFSFSFPPKLRLYSERKKPYTRLHHTSSYQVIVFVNVMNITTSNLTLIWPFVFENYCGLSSLRTVVTSHFFACRMYDSSQFQCNVCCYRILHLLVFVFACLYNLSLQAWIVISKEMHYRIW